MLKDLKSGCLKRRQNKTKLRLSFTQKYCILGGI